MSAALALVVGVVVAVPAMAAEPAAQARSRPLAAATATKVAGLDVPASAFAQAAPAATAGDSKPFLKTTKGALAVALLAGGIVWVVVSRNKDAVQSPARD